MKTRPFIDLCAQTLMVLYSSSVLAGKSLHKNPALHTQSCRPAVEQTMNPQLFFLLSSSPRSNTILTTTIPISSTNTKDQGTAVHTSPAWPPDHTSLLLAPFPPSLFIVNFISSRITRSPATAARKKIQRHHLSSCDGGEGNQDNNEDMEEGARPNRGQAEQESEGSSIPVPRQAAPRRRRPRRPRAHA